jgi:arthrofactin-type cyclic lipopeptide synthetase C
MVDHAAWLNHNSYVLDAFALSKNDRVLQFSSLSADASLEELLPPLVRGATLIPRSQHVLETQLFGRFLCEERITVLNLPTAYWHGLAAAITDGWAVNNCVRLVVVGGEKLSTKSIVGCTWLQEKGLEFLNTYGPSETTITASLHSVSLGEQEDIPIGHPIANAQIYILDDQQRPVPVGVVGELYIGGAGVGRGYLNRAHLTAERFLPDAHSREPGARVYRTGDLARYRSDGNIEFLGRNDFQVKIRGFRVELREIEARLAQYPGIQEAVVLARDDTTGDRRLVAYYKTTLPGSGRNDEVARPTAEKMPAYGRSIDTELLRSHLLEMLPMYMVPAAYVELTSWPLTPNGKVDRKALPEPGSGAYVSREFEAPLGETEEAVARIWSEVLGVERVGRRDDFFELGGHSLLAVTLIERMRRAGFDATVQKLITTPGFASFVSTLPLSAPVATSATGIVDIRAAGTQRPLFLLPELGGQGTYFSLLGAEIDAGIPVYGLTAIPVDELQPTTMEGLATHMLGLIRQVQPFGPYRLAGWSIGGLLAYEIAMQIVGQDQKVEFLGVFDQEVPQDGGAPSTTLQEFLITYLPAFNKGSLTKEEMTTLDELKRLAKTEDFETVVRRCQELGVLPWARGTHHFQKFVQRMMTYEAAMTNYVLQPISVPIDIFTASEQPPGTPPFLGWEAILPKTQIRLTRIPGNHTSMMTAPYVRDLGRAVSAAIQDGDKESVLTPAEHESYDPTVVIRSGPVNAAETIVCIPGAGSPATDFFDLSIALGDERRVYGMHPSGLDGVQVPHSTVEAAAQLYIKHIEAVAPRGPLHLIGHSFGGWVAFEIAARLRERARSIASLTLIDSNPPGPGAREWPEYNTAQILKEFANVIQEGTDRPLNLDPKFFEARSSVAHSLGLLREAMIRVGLMTSRASTEVLNGPFRHFSAALRARYVPRSTYRGEVYLALANSTTIESAEANSASQEDKQRAWHEYAPKLVSWVGVGTHSTILSRPNVQILADWWLSCRVSRG